MRKILDEEATTDEATAEESSPAFLALSIVRAIWKRRFCVAAVWLVSGISTVAIVRQLPVVYMAQAVILVDSQAIPEKFVTATVAADVQGRMAAIGQRILSSEKLRRIIDEFGLYREERKTRSFERVLELMRKDISITADKADSLGSVGRPVVFRIGYQGGDPQLVTQVANRLTSLYVEQDLKTREVQAEDTSEFLRGQLQEAKKKLDVLEAAVSSYKLKHNGELPQQQDALVSTLSRLQVELESNRDAVNRAQQTKIILASSLNMAETTMAGQLRATQSIRTTETIKDPTALQKRMITLQEQLAKLQALYRDNHPDMMRLRAEIEAVKRAEERERAANADLDENGSRTKSSIEPSESVEVGRVRQQITQLRAQIESIDREMADRRAEQLRIVSDIVSCQNRMGRLPVREQEMAQITRDYEISKDNYKSLLEKKTAAGMALEMERRQKSERLTVLDPARVPDRPVKPKRELLYAVGTVLGLALALIVGFSVELHQNVFLGEWELPAATPVLARLPHM
jgi:polysaccharide biosynthesis transport protein